MGRGTLGGFGTGRGTLSEVLDGLGDPRGGPGWVRGPSGRSGTGRVTLGEVQDGLQDSWEGPGRVR